MLYDVICNGSNRGVIGCALTEAEARAVKAAADAIDRSRDHRGKPAPHHATIAPHAPGNVPTEGEFRIYLRRAESRVPTPVYVAPLKG